MNIQLKELETRDHGVVYINVNHVVAVKQSDHGVEIHLSVPLYGKMNYFLSELDIDQVLDALEA